MLDNILFAPAHLFEQMEVERAFDSVWDRVEPLLQKEQKIDEIFCRTGALGQYCIAAGYSWMGWDDDPAMLERVMLTRGFQYAGLGGWSRLPMAQSEVILGCFAPLSQIAHPLLDDFMKHLHFALQEKGYCLLEDWIPKESTPLHRSYNGQKEKWVAMCVPKKEAAVIHFAWHWMGSKGNEPIKRFVEEDIRYVHSASEIRSAARRAGFTVTLQDGWWILRK